MKLFNTLGRRLEEFKPINPGKVSLYTCGPTVYDYAQLGNLRSFIFDDTLRRVLEASGYSVAHVMNITDVGHLASDMDEGEDKLEKGARREGKSVWDVANYYIKSFKEDVELLNILAPNGYSSPSGPYPRATDFIRQQVEILQLLFEKDYAYQTKEAIYFDTSKLSNYGELTGQRLEEKEVGARSDVKTDPQKRHPQDFALWFFLVGRFANHTMRWPSPWGEGFPGWHLECSAIIHETLGDPIDIHTGGVDHIGTHHPNEMAQTEAAFGHKLAHYWLHNEFLQVEGKRMGKSMGNFYTLKDVVDRGYDPLALRLLFLQAHYRSQMNFTWQSLQGAQNLLGSLRAFADLAWQVPDASQPSGELAKLWQEILRLLQDDLNTPAALALLSEAQNKQLLYLASEDKASFKDFLKNIDAVFGLDLSSRQDLSNEQYGLIDDREQARKSKDWNKADQLRAELTEQGIEINDDTKTAVGLIWSRKK